MLWFEGEPTLDDLLSDPVVLALMQRDGIGPDEVRELLSEIERSQSRGKSAPREDLPPPLPSAGSARGTCCGAAPW
jgi:hypothetical protein